MGDRPTGFVIIPGAWHCGAHWLPVVNHLARRGHPAEALDLPGSGLGAVMARSVMDRDIGSIPTEPSPLAAYDLDTYVTFVVGELERGARHGPIVLVGHSFGGVVATQVAERVPQLVGHLVYVTGHVPVTPSARSCAECDALPENRTSLSPSVVVGDPEKLGAVRVDVRSTDPEYLRAAHAAFYGDVPFEDFPAWAAYLTSELPLHAVRGRVEVSAERWGAVPRSYIRCTADRAIPIALQDRMIDEADRKFPANPFRVLSMDASHSPFASRPSELAELLLTSARG